MDSEQISSCGWGGVGLWWGFGWIEACRLWTNGAKDKDKSKIVDSIDMARYGRHYGMA